MHRRKFIESAGFGGLGLGLPAIGLLAQKGVLAQTVTDYRALVCVYLFGGNDGYNTLVPYETTAHAQYLQLRPEFNSISQRGLGIPRQALLPLQPQSGNAPLLGLNPALTRVHARWAQGQVAWVQNVGNLVEPVQRSTFAQKRKPQAIGGHIEQQDISMLALQSQQGLGAEHGWASRLVQQASGRGIFSANDFSLISFAGQNRLQSSPNWPVTVLPPNVQLTLNSAPEIGPLLTQGKASSRPFTRAYSNAVAGAYAKGAAVNGVFTQSGTAAQIAFDAATFGGRNTGALRSQLLAVARFIEARSQLQVPGRQVFFVAAGGYDTHTNQYAGHMDSLAEVDTALHGFFSAIEALGLGQQVTAFTMSDFGRTLRMNASQGTDHAWASHLLVMGGAVRGGMYGRTADLRATSEDIAPFDSNLVIPSTSINQYAATLAAWMGLNSSDLNAVFPDLRNFSLPNLGFMNS